MASHQNLQIYIAEQEQTELLMNKTKRQELIEEEQLQVSLVTRQKSSDLESSTTSHNQHQTRSTLLLNDLQKQKEEEKRKVAKDAKKAFRRLFAYTWKNKHLLIVANIALIISSGSMIVFPALCGQMIDTIRQNGDLAPGAVKFAILTVFMAVFSAMRGYSFNMLGQLVMVQMRLELFNKILTKDIAYYDKTKSGELLSRLGSDIATIKSVCSDNLSMIIRNFFQFLGSLIFLWLLSWKLTLLIIVLTPIISFGLLFLFKYIGKQEKQYSNRLAKVSALVTEVFGNIRVVRSFSNEQAQNQNYKVLLQKVYETGKKKSILYGIMLIIMTAFSNILILSILFYGGHLVIDGEMTIGDLTSYILYAITLTIGFASISGIINQTISALGICENIFQIMDEPVKVISGNIKINYNQINNKQPIIQFQNVCFSYPSKEAVEILKGVSIKIYHGQSVAIVGPSGSGKSSLISLMLRFYDVNQGSVKIYGTNIKDIDIKQLREHIGYVSQEPTLFSGSLQQNIQYGLRNIRNKDQIINQSLQNANAKEFVFNEQLFPQKLATLVGERGVKLSGGQKQRIAIARCLAKQPKIMIFDEATSALDAQSQYQVQNAIDSLLNKHDRTMVIVAHRLSTIINCDRIIVIKDGLIAEQGKHTELLSRKGIYAHLVQRQLTSQIQ